MNRTRLVFIGILALALGLFASALTYKALQQRTAGPAELEPVVVAAIEIPVGTRLQEKDVRLVGLPAEAVPPGSFHHVKDVKDRGVIAPIGPGEFILAGRNLASLNAGAGLPSMIPSGMRAVSVRVTDISSVGGFVAPGTRVDVLMTGNPGSGEAQTVTVLKNVAVLANGSRMDKSAFGGETVTNSPVITLLVSPDDAERLALASAQGKIQLALRNPLDTSQNDVAAVNLRSLYPSPKPTTNASATHAKAKPAVQTLPPQPTAYGVEVIKGDKRDEMKLSD